MRIIKDLLDKLTELYPPPTGIAHCIAVGRDGRLQLSVWDGDERVPMSLDEEDLGKGAAELVEDVRPLVAIYRHARSLSEAHLSEKLKQPWAEYEAERRHFEAVEGPLPTTVPLVRAMREHFEDQQKGFDEAERQAVLSGIDYVMRQRQPFGCTVRLSLAERFLNWYAGHTKLYIRGQRGKDWNEQRRLDAELAVALEPFLRQLVDEEVGLRLAEQHVGADTAGLSVSGMAQGEHDDAL